MENQEKLLRDHSDLEKGAYLAAIASLATADRSATEEELRYIEALADSADVSPEQKALIHNAATELTGAELKRCLDILKVSDLRFSLMTDLIAFAEADENYTVEERARIDKIADYLDINRQQIGLLDEFVQKTKQVNVTPADVNEPGLLDRLGLGEKFRGAGINSNSFVKGLLGVVGPLILSRALSRGGRSFPGGLGSGTISGGGFAGRSPGFGGFGSLINILNGGRGLRSTSDLLSRIFRL